MQVGQQRRRHAARDVLAPPAIDTTRVDLKYIRFILVRYEYVNYADNTTRVDLKFIRVKVWCCYFIHTLRVC